MCRSFVPKFRELSSSTRVRQGGMGYTMFVSARYAYDYGPFIYDVVAEYLAENSPYTAYTDGKVGIK